ncbi:MAG: hypothetical protein RLO17_17895 [Cyclobacteriaceae bacterium]
MKKFTTALLMIFAVSLFAQKQAAWTTSFDGPVNWQRVTSLGQLVVNSGNSLVGIDTDTGDRLWKIDGFLNLDINSYQGIGNSNFFTITTFSGDETQFQLINSLNGKVLMNSVDEGVADILSSDILPRLGLLVMVVEKTGAGQASLIALDINSGVIRWSNDEIFKVDLGNSFGSGALGSLLNQAASTATNEANKQGLMASPMALDDNSLLLLHPNFSYCINPETGEELWNIPNEGSAIRVSAETTSLQPGIVFIGVEKEQSQSSGATFTTSTGSSGPTTEFLLHAVEIRSGKPIWKNPYKENNASLSRLILDESGIIISPPTSGFKVSLNKLSYETGESMWGKKGKGIKVKGSIVDHELFEEGYLVVNAYDNAWNNAGDEYYVNILNPADGSLRFNKDIKLSGDLISTELREKGLLYITSLEINMLDLSSGDQLFDSPQAAKPLDASNFDPLKHSLPYTQKGEMLYAFSSKDDMLYEIDKTAGTLRAVGSKIKFEGKEVPYQLEVQSDGVVLSAEQNIMKVGMDGTVKYQNYYPAPRQSGLLRAVAAAQALRAAYIGAVSAAYSAAFAESASQSDDALGQEIGNELSQGFGELSNQGFAYSKDAISFANARFKASAKTPEFMFILTETDKKEYGLVQVDKLTGTAVSTIDLNKDKEPSYELDEIFSRVYYRSAANQIECYQF